MKRKITYTLIGWFVAGGLLWALSGGCTRREFEEVQPSGNVTLNFNWKNLKTGDNLPTGMQLYFYPPDGSPLMREGSSSGFSGSLPPGTYQVLAYNNDGKNVEQRNLGSYGSAEIYAPAYTRASSYLSQPSHCYGVGLGTLTVLEGDSASATMVPRNFVRQAVISVGSGEYADQIRSCSGSLSGFATGAYISSGELVKENGDLYFNTQKDNSSFTGGVSFFGKDTSEKNILHMEFTMNTGSVQFLNADITDQLDQANAGEVDVSIEATVEVLNMEAVLSSVTINPREQVNGGNGEVQ